MGPMQAVMSGVITIVFYAMVIAAVWKLFMMAADLGEIKTLLTDIRRNTTGPAAIASPVPAVGSVAVASAVPAGVAQAAPVTPAPAPAPPVLAGPISLESAEALLREVAAEEQALAQQAKNTGTELASR